MCINVDVYGVNNDGTSLITDRNLTSVMTKKETNRQYLFFSSVMNALLSQRELYVLVLFAGGCSLTFTGSSGSSSSSSLSSTSSSPAAGSPGKSQSHRI